jgi:hypothetical protein
MGDDDDEEEDEEYEEDEQEDEDDLSIADTNYNRSSCPTVKPMFQKRVRGCSCCMLTVLLKLETVVSPRQTRKKSLHCSGSAILQKNSAQVLFILIIIILNKCPVRLGTD